MSEPVEVYICNFCEHSTKKDAEIIFHIYYSHGQDMETAYNHFKHVTLNTFGEKNPINDKEEEAVSMISEEPSFLDSDFQGALEIDIENEPNEHEAVQLGGSEEKEPVKLSEFNESGPVQTHEYKENSNLVWNHNQTVHFLELYKEYKILFDTKIKKRVWEHFTKDINKALRTNFSVQNCSSKWDRLCRTYKQKKTQNSQSGSHRESWEYFGIMEEILGKSPQVAAPFTCSSLTNAVVSPKSPKKKSSDCEVQTPESHTGNAEKSPTVQKIPAHKQPLRSNFSRAREEKESMVNRRHRERMEKQEEAIKILKSFTEKFLPKSD